MSAIVVPRVTCDLLVAPVVLKSSWKHLSDIPLADPDFGRPARIDLLLGVDIFTSSLLFGRWIRPPGSPTAIETKFGWVLAGCIGSSDLSPHQITTHHVSLITGDDLLRRFWEIEEGLRNEANLSPEARAVVQHFKDNYRRTRVEDSLFPLSKGQLRNHNH